MTSCTDLGSGSARWSAHVKLSDGESGNVGPYVQKRGTTLIEPPVKLSRVSVQVQMQLTPPSALGLCASYSVIVIGPV